MNIFTKNRQKKHLKNRIGGTQRAMWDLEFMIVQKRSIREGIRLEHDRIAERVNVLDLTRRVVKQYGAEIGYALINKGPELAEQSLRDGEATAVSEQLGRDLPAKYKLNDTDKGALEQIDANLKPLATDLEQLKIQLEGLDREIDDTVAKLGDTNEVKKMLEEYIRQI